MHKTLGLVLMVGILSLSGCAAPRSSSGKPVTQSDEFECNQKCGYYDPKANPFVGGMCKADCLRSKGY
jgi:hypothetical protein